MNTSERAYVKPQLKRIGSFEEITQAASVGPTYDATYPAGTPHVPDRGNIGDPLS
jgi:hypothetical protein